jgi:(2Fe-2S) ferredoxin
MKAVPMIFNTEMVKALLDGRKTVTRRPMKPQPTDSGSGYMWWPSKNLQTMVNLDKAKGDLYWDGLASDICPIASVGDLIYVRETFCHQPCGNAPELTVYKSGYPSNLLERYESVMNEEDIRWTPSIHMPRWASRLTLKVTDVRLERVQDITKEQAQAEGVQPTGCTKGYWETAYQRIWNSIYGNWEQNPYVWVIEFEVIHKNVDEVLNG